MCHTTGLYCPRINSTLSIGIIVDKRKEKKKDRQESHPEGKLRPFQFYCPSVIVVWITSEGRWKALRNSGRAMTESFVIVGGLPWTWSMLSNIWLRSTHFFLSLFCIHQQNNCGCCCSAYAYAALSIVSFSFFVSVHTAHIVTASTYVTVYPRIDVYIYLSLQYKYRHKHQRAHTHRTLFFQEKGSRAHTTTHTRRVEEEEK